MRYRYERLRPCAFTLNKRGLVPTGYCHTGYCRTVASSLSNGTYSYYSRTPTRMPSITDPDNDALFIMDQGGKLAAFNFMIVIRRHPLFFIALQGSLKNRIIHPDTGLMNPIKLTGPVAFGKAIYQFIRLGSPDRGRITKLPLSAQPGVHTRVSTLDLHESCLTPKRTKIIGYCERSKHPGSKRSGNTRR